MPVIFTDRRGYVVAVPLGRRGATSPATIRVAGMALGGTEDTTARTLITQMGLIQDGNFVRSHSLDKAVFIYAFGDLAGEVRLSGLCFAYTCVAPTDKQSGIQKILRLYKENKLAVRRSLIQINVGDTALSGVLTGMTLEITDAEHNMGQWSLKFLKFPDV